MSVIIRLQNLPWSANALDIRQYFRGLSIPEGGVHIVGGELGDAFIAFSTDEDARQAFNMNGGKIKEIQIKLLLSSRTEMQKVIEAARNPTPFMQVPPPQPLTLPAQVAAIVAESAKVDPKMDAAAKLGDKKIKRSRSRSRERRDRRDRSRDRSRDRKDRRRRDRSRSRDRRDRHRRDRSRSRNRSRTHDRSRSRDRDTRRSRDKKKDPLSNMDDKGLAGDLSSGSTTATDLTEAPAPVTTGAVGSTNVWEVTPPPMHKNNFNMPPRNGPPGNPAPFKNFDQPRRMLGPNQNKSIDGKEPIQGDGPNEFRGRESWPPTHNNCFNDGRFNDKIPKASPSSPSPNMFRNDGGRGLNNNRNGRNNFERNNMFGGGDSRPNSSGPGGAGMVRPLLGRPMNMLGGQHFSPFDNSVDNSIQGSSDHSADFHREIKPKVPRPGCCVKVLIGRGGYGDVRRFFQGLFIANDGVKLLNDDEGRRTGMAFVRFVRPEGKMEALQRSGTAYRGIPVEIFHVDDDEFDKAVDSFVPPHDNSMGNDVRNRDRANIYGENMIRNNEIIDSKICCIAISNLPPYTKEHDIITMIGDFPLVSVLMVMSKDSQQLAYIQFSRAEDAHVFFNIRERHAINGKPVTIQLVSENVFFDVKRQHNSGNGIVCVPDDKPAPKGSSSLNGGFKNEIISDCVVLRGLPHKTSDRDIIDFFSDVGLVPNRIHVPLGKMNKQSDCFCEFIDTNEAELAITKNGTPMGMCDVTVELVPRREMEQMIGISSQSPDGRFNNSQFGAQRRALLGTPMQQRPQQPQYIPEAFRNPGCVLSLENVPFRAGVDEILEFFQDFDIPEENVMRRFNDRGHPTGDARVAFSSSLEAQRAFSELRHCKIRDRTIFMHLQ